MKRMYPGHFGVIILAAALFCCMTVASPSAWAQVKLSYANASPPGSFPVIQMERWKAEVEKKTQGKVKVNTFPGGTLLSAKATFDGVISGQADIGCFSMSYQPGRFPVSEAVDMPIGIPSAKVGSALLYDLIAKYNPKEYSDVKVLTVFTCPPMNVMSDRPVKTLADLKGLDLRTAGVGSDIIRLLGGIPVGMPAVDTPEALQKGVVKGVVSSLDTLKDFNFAAYCPYTTMLRLHVVGFAVVMNKKKWNSLPPDVKKVMEDMAREHAVWTGDRVDGITKAAVDWAKKKYKHEIINVSDQEKAKLAAALKPLITNYVARVTKAGLPGDEIMKDVTTMRDKLEKQYK